MIRRLEERDLEPLYELDSDQEVKRYVGGSVQLPRDQWIGRMREKLGTGSCPLAISLRQDASFVGRASLCEIGFAPNPPDRVRDRECELQILIARNYWGKGLGFDTANALLQAAFASDHVASIVAVIHPDNTASLNLMDKLGFNFVELKHSPTNWNHQHKIFRLAWPPKDAVAAVPAPSIHSSHG